MIKSLISPLVALLLMFSSSCANDSYSEEITSMENQTQAPKQKELNNIHDYNQMVGDLKQGAGLGDPDSNLYLGVVYLNGVTLKDGTVVKPSRADATKLLLTAISLGSAKALGFLAAKSIETFDVASLSDAVKVAQQSESIKIEDKDYYSLMLASLILDKNSDDANAIEIATKWIYEAEKKRPTPKMQYILASMYSKLQNIDAANYYINKSCSNSQLDAQLSTLCQQLKSDSNNGGESEKTCQKP